GRPRAVSQRRTDDDGGYSWSPVRRPVLGRGSPSPTTPRYRRGPPSPGTRPRRQRSPSPMVCSSPDPANFSSSEEVEPSEDAVTSSEDADQLDLEDGRGISSHVLQLSPILEVDGLPETSVSPGSGSPILSPAAAILHCQASIDANGDDLVCLSSSSHLGMAVIGPIGGGAEHVVASGVCTGEADRADGGVALAAIEGDVVVPGATTGGFRVVADDVRCPKVPRLLLAGQRVESRGIEGEALDSEMVSSVSSSHQATAVSVDFDALDATSSVDARTEIFHAGEARTEAVVSLGCPIRPLFYDQGGSMGLGDGGSVSEEVRVASVAREALRSQPTDGLR
ncbi:hypothetical protein Dimus_036739, partial [Dionaea muscipula]